MLPLARARALKHTLLLSEALIENARTLAQRDALAGLGLVGFGRRPLFWPSVNESPGVALQAKVSTQCPISRYDPARGARDPTWATIDLSIEAMRSIFGALKPICPSG